MTAPFHNLPPQTQWLVNTIQELSLAKNLNEIMRIVRKVAREITGADGASFVLRDGNLCYYADEDAISPLWKGSRFPMTSCVSGWVMLNKSPVMIKDIYADERVPADAYRPTFVKSLAMVPIRTQAPIGAIGNYWANHHQPTADEINALQALADITSVSIENVEIKARLNEKLKERTQMLSQLTKQKEQLEEFTFTITHTLRAPLANLRLLGDMVQTQKDLDKKLAILEKQKPILDFLHQVFEEVEDAMHVQKDFAITRDHIVLERSLEKAKTRLNEKGAAGTPSITHDFSKAPTAYFPKSYLESIFINLLSNAIRFSSPDRLPQIHVRSYKKSGWTWIDVQDNGSGIDLQKHGDKLFMLRKTFHDHPKSKGFGLFITKTQLEAMGGSIKVKSIPGTGSTFSIKLNQNK